MKTVGVVTNTVSKGYKRLFETLGKILNLSFEERLFRLDPTVCAWVVLNANQECVSRISQSDRQCYVVIADDQLVPNGKSSVITFSRHTALKDILNNRKINLDEAVELKTLPRWLTNMTALAFKETAPVWGISENQKTCHHYVAMPIPEMKENEPLVTYFNGKQFLGLLPLLLFLKSFNEDHCWRYPPLQASFMFDDPNLHWKTYGFIDFAELLNHAKLFNYHVSFATIPIDTWFVYPPTGTLFKENINRISLLIHGNDHVSNELARPIAVKKIEKILGQSLRRISKMEKREGIKVARVMAAPHGACSEESLSLMSQLGFEAACISSGSLRYHNKSAKWTLQIGMKPCDVIAGLPVFSRFALSENCHNNILISALLHQPIIPRAHHKDVAEGYHILDDLSIFINSLGNVTWADMETIARSQYASRVDGNILHIKMLTHHIEVPIPDSVNLISIEHPISNDGSYVPKLWRILEENTNWNSIEFQEGIPVHPGKTVEIMMNPVVRSPEATGIIESLKPYPFVRRIMTEARDRIYPYLKRINVKSRGK
jgi:hypothetical protein